MSYFDLDEFEAELKAGKYSTIVESILKKGKTGRAKIAKKAVSKEPVAVAKPIINNDVPSSITRYVRESTCVCGKVYRLHTTDMIKYVNGLRVYYKPVTVANKKDADGLRHLEPAEMVTKENILSCPNCVVF